ncbi:MAG: phosphatidylserine decarboxylase [Acidobacteriota bacterium]
MTHASDHPVVARLRSQITSDPTFAGYLESSILLARERGRQTLDPALYEALNDQAYNCWPLTLTGYLDYLNGFLQLIPRENQNLDVWKDPASGYSQEVYDRLCQFYWLIDQQTPVIPDDIGVVQNYRDGDFVFALWLDDYAKAWGTFLDSPESLTAETLQSFWDDPSYQVGNSSQYADTWRSFNDFFSRQLNPGLRPITSPNGNVQIVAPADCTYRQTFPIAEDGTIPAITIKQTHTVATVAQLLQDDALAAHFHGGTFVHYFLTPYNYHRFHAPVNGTVDESRVVQGQAYLGVDITGDGQFDAPDASNAEGSPDGSSGYEFLQTRGVLVIDTSSHPDPAQRIGRVAVAPIGMAQVSGVVMNAKVGDTIAKGAEFGHFLFGGSDIILLFERDADLTLVTTDSDAAQTPFAFHYGNVVAYWNGRRD